ncbi:hypothetical protein ACQEV4_01065 [Streptomyces shenzhenensis]|uniref:hypothetical protein n=1 Tax=Streptomyces shenzhenensis TaxID=943815 RepID=UPI003D94C4BA
MIPDALPAHRDIPVRLLAGLTAWYASHRDFHALSGVFPDPGDVRPEQVAAALAGELTHPDAEVLPRAANSGGWSASRPPSPGTLVRTIRTGGSGR